MANETAGDYLRAAMNTQGITDNVLRAGIAAIAGGESGLTPRSETTYRNTSNARIRSVFGAAAKYSDAQLNALKADDAKFFEAMYGVGTSAGRQLGNTQPGDGYLYRGRGYFQLTGRGNYERYGHMTGRDLIDDPDLANEPDVAASIAVAYIRDRYHGGGFEAMKRAVGNIVPSTEATKDALFQKFLASGEFAVGAPVGAAALAPGADLGLGASGPEVVKIQTALIKAGFYCGPQGADGMFGNATEAALKTFQQDHALAVSGNVDAPTRAALGVP